MTFKKVYVNILIMKSKNKNSEIVFARHGESEANVGNYLAGQMESELTDRGVGQARELGRSLREDGLSFDVIASSPLRRASETARIVAEEIGYTGDIPSLLELTERNGGKFQGENLQDFYKASDDDIVAAGGESLREFSDRSRRASMLLGTFTAGRVLAIGHAESYRMMVSNLRKLDPKNYQMIERPENAMLYPFPQSKRDAIRHKLITRSVSMQLKRLEDSEPVLSQ